MSIFNSFRRALSRPSASTKAWINNGVKFQYRPRYLGPVRAVVFDWAGTLIDCGVFSPAAAFVEVFKREGVPITIQEAREPMGLHKEVHLRRIAAMPTVKERWQEAFNRPPNDEDIERMYHAFKPIQMESLEDYTEILPGVIETLTSLQQEGIKIGVTTGYTEEMVHLILESCANQGFTPDASVAADEVPQARPYAMMIWQNLINFNLDAPIDSVIKVDDTVDGIREGIHAGCWTVGVARSGNYMGHSEEEMENMSDEEYEAKLAKSYETLANSGAHYVIDDVTQLPAVIEDINLKLAAGISPRD
jgi:phosphonoacetaldehyde hydrolase